MAFTAILTSYWTLKTTEHQSYSYIILSVWSLQNIIHKEVKKGGQSVHKWQSLRKLFTNSSPHP